MAMESAKDGNVVTKLCENVKLPRMVKIIQKFDESHIASRDITETVRDRLSHPEIKNRIKPGMSVAITSGSRGIANIVVITKAIVDFVRECGAEMGHKSG